ncbi:hypothetical protein [Halomonas sp. NO4]|uniref:hypothetical protein n=1 Tax=Halomonas sp. NO4 TaxID=2484813 RepID=UPI0013D08804|nr:hypothetical protein [Halomonas sp. NO4]
MTLYIAFSANGDIETRNTTREYTHAVFSGTTTVVRKGRDVFTGDPDGILGFSGRRDLAEKTVSEWRHRYPEAYVVEAYPVTIDRTGPDWEPTKDMKWFAQVEDGSDVPPFVFGPTKKAVIEKLEAGEFE